MDFQTRFATEDVCLLSETERAAWSIWPPEDDEETIGAYFGVARP